MNDRHPVAVHHETPAIRTLLDQATHSLTGASARLDAELLLAACLEKPRSYLHAWPEHCVEPAQQERFEILVSRRSAGEPVAYLLGEREFWSLPLAVTPDTLIPRPETETLVALALEKIPAGQPLRIADLGTGCGAIALAIASERPACRITATDISEPALAIATKNAARLGITNVHFVAGDWCQALPPQGFEFILSNPPYVAADDPHLHAGDVRHEPRQALVAGPEGMDELRRITHCAKHHLCRDGWLMLEHGYDQGSQVAELLATAGYRDVCGHADAAGLSRVTLGRYQPAPGGSVKPVLAI